MISPSIFIMAFPTNLIIQSRNTLALFSVLDTHLKGIISYLPVVTPRLSYLMVKLGLSYMNSVQMKTVTKAPSSLLRGHPTPKKYLHAQPT